MTPLVEKRKFDRFGFQKSVQVFPVIPSKSGYIYEIQHKPINAWVNDISEQGLRLEVVRTFDPNFILKFNFEFDKNQWLEAFGKIIWSFDNHSGVHFMLVDPRLRQTIKAISDRTKN